ncbi:hypothetical protein Bca4012_026801 [Brassica carinata]|uniref:Uncharacterized protein n=1 Tax=Brassica carinata TaxID=52824 RepID=A0A8X7VJ80_BRACI|nr:hypothetical protein Bca52824_023784 [Brassica carinata]
MARDDLTGIGIIPLTTHFATMMTTMKAFNDCLTRQNATRKVTNDRLDVIAAAVKLPAANDNKPETPCR